MIHILKLAGNGVPQAWLSVEEAALHYAADEVTWEAGQPIVTLHGGTNAALIDGVEQLAAPPWRS